MTIEVYLSTEQAQFFDGMVKVGAKVKGEIKFFPGTAWNQRLYTYAFAGLTGKAK